MMFTKRFFRVQRVQLSTAAAASASSQPSVVAISSLFRDLGAGQVELSFPRKSVAQITLNNPVRKNSISPSMMVQFLNAVEELENITATESPLVGVVVNGEESTFCSGFDLTSAASSFSDPSSPIKHHSTFMHAIISRLRSLPLISIAAVDGFAYGGGAELMTAMDLRVINENATISFVQATMGLTPGWQGGYHLTRLVGRASALKILAGSEKYSGSECLDLGLADEVCGDSPSTLERALTILESYTDEADPSVIRGMKRVVNNADLGDQNSMDREREIFAEFWGSGPNQRAIAKARRPKKAMD